MVFANPQHIKKTNKSATAQNIPTRQLENMYLTAYRQGQYIKAFRGCVECINREPMEEIHKLRLSTMVMPIRLNNFDLKVKQALALSLKSKMLDRQAFSSAWLETLMRDPTHIALTALYGIKEYEDFKKSIQWQNLQISLVDEFLYDGLRSLIIIDTHMEHLIVNLRRWLLEKAAATQMLQDEHLKFLCALAEHCFLREYPFLQSEEETTQLEELQIKANKGKASAIEIALLAAYIPLYNGAKTNVILQNHKNHKGLKDLLRLQIENAQTEAALKEKLESFTEIKDKTSKAVQNMYEENPYPRWGRVIVKPNLSLDVTGDILIAGCGTSRATLSFAQKFPNINFTAIDLSKASICYGWRKAREYGAFNVDYKHGDILDLKKLEREFDFIECSGVLHHMADPIAGWKSLLSVLKPGGVMNICLYSTVARRAIHKARDYIKEQGYKSTLEDIRKLRADIIALPDDHPMKPVQGKRDFQSTSECRDLVFHVQEETYTIPELQQIFEDLGLHFIGFKIDIPAYETAYKQKFPDDPTMRNLDNWNELENEVTNMFAGMYQMIITRKEDADNFNECSDQIIKSGIFRLAGSS